MPHRASLMQLKSFMAQQVQWQSVAEANYTQYLAAQKL